jgi:hypothetical protein
MFLERMVLLDSPLTSTSHVKTYSIFHCQKISITNSTLPLPLLSILQSPPPFADTLMDEAETGFVLTKSLCESGHQKRI